MTDEDLDPRSPSQSLPITSWRTAASAFRTQGRRLEALLTASAVAVAYLLCLTVAGAVAVAVNALAVEPALKVLTGWTLDLGVAQLAEGFVEGAVVGGPAFFGIRWLVICGLARLQPTIDRWMEEN